MTDLGIPGVGDATVIASGGSALVYRARNGTGEPIAIKVLRGIHGAEVTRRFEREISAAERLSGHPNIIAVHNTGITAAGEPYLVMPLMSGGSLNDELDERGAFPLHQATGDIATAAEALEFAHNRGVLHRDIKPGNLLRRDDGSIVVTDFGIARVVDAGITSATVGASTPLYAAPEILTENAASVRSEVYGLGATLYALLNGQAAFADSENIWATMHRIRTEMPAPIVGVPAPVMRVIDQAMAKDPLDRPVSAQSFRNNLRDALTANDTWIPPTTTAEWPSDEVLLGPSMLESPPSVPVVTVAPVTRDDLAAPTTAAAVVPPPAPAIGRAPLAAPPPVPAFDRPAPAVGRTKTRRMAPAREGSGAKIVAATIALALIAGAAWWATDRLLRRNDIDNTAITPPVDNSLPSPDTGEDADNPPTDNPTDPDGDVGDDGDSDNGEVAIDDLPDSPLVPNRFVSFTGDHFTALLPEGWSLAARDIEESYGFRSRFVNDSMYLNIDTTPKEQREPGGDIAQSARDIAAGIASASEVRTETVDGLTMHSFTFRNAQGVDSIDIFFEVDGDGYAVVAGSAAQPDVAFATARLVALSVRSNPS